MKTSMKEMVKLSFGEEVGNSVSHGTMAIITLFLIPFVAVYSYIQGGFIRSISESVYIICIFLMLIGSSIYHAMDFSSKHKYVMRKIDHCFIFLAIAGTYTPVLVNVVGGWLGYSLLVVEWLATVAGIILTSASRYYHKKLSMAIYMTMGWLAVIIIPLIYGHGIAFFMMILLGGLFYTIGAIFYSKKKPYAHFVWHIFIILATIAHFIAVVFMI